MSTEGGKLVKNLGVNESRVWLRNTKKILSKKLLAIVIMIVYNDFKNRKISLIFKTEEI